MIENVKFGELTFSIKRNSKKPWRDMVKIRHFKKCLYSGTPPQLFNMLSALKVVSKEMEGK